ncbi:exosortase Y [Pedobacter sp. GR22-6]|uniref:exosortase Y n=1 Tax=Pedobacter sp. GR22-6 TaxID=3127957 RepID=UPI00307D7DA9
MKNTDISIIILTYNEELHLPRLISSLSTLHAPTYVLDSYSNDRTLEICKENQVIFAQHRFHNHPQQWDHALKVFPISTPWVICLDADQVLSNELIGLLKVFRNEAHSTIDGIYFNRKNYFRGSWIKYGGYFPKYLLKMFRYGKGWSDLNENMDHRFIVTGKTKVWKSGYLIEENIKENCISFWLTKHNRYSDLLAEEELYKRKYPILPSIHPSLFGAPNNRKLWLKNLWTKLPLYLRPALYLFYRLIIRGGILDGRTGIIFHFLQGFWFRLVVDMKLEELQHKENQQRKDNFLIRFVILFSLLYGTHIFFIAVSTPGGFYIKWFDQHINYIKAWRKLDIHASAFLLRNFGYTVYTNETGLSVRHYSGFRLVYSCLGYGIMSSFTAFVLAFPKPLKTKFGFIFLGVITIQLMNILRLVLIALFYKSDNFFDHHLLFNISIYLLIALFIYLWTDTPN